MSTREAYERKLRAKLDEWNAEIAKLRARAEQADADAQADYYRQIDELQREQEEARRRLEELRQSGEDAWHDLKVGIEQAWDRLGTSIKSAAARFK